VLAMVVKHFSFHLKPGHVVWPALQVTLRPENGLPMIIRQRSLNDSSRPELANRYVADGAPRDYSAACAR